MRYNDWDVLLFPTDSIVPVKEFRVDCHLVHDIGNGTKEAHYWSRDAAHR